MTKLTRRTITLRNERTGDDERFLFASVDTDGVLRLEGQDYGPGTAAMSNTGKHEWVTLIAREDIPKLVKALDGKSTDDLMDLLERDWTGAKSYEFEKRVRQSGIKTRQG